MERAEHAAGDDPAENRGEREYNGEGGQRVLQEMREGDVTLVTRALKLEVRVALGKESIVGVGAALFGAAEREEAGGSLLSLPLRLDSRD